MLKKTIFLSLAIGLISNSALADCHTRYVIARQNAQSRFGQTGAVTGMAGTISGLFVSEQSPKLKFDKGSVVSTAGVAAGALTTGMEKLILSDINSSINLLEEAEVGTGLQLSHMTSMINSGGRDIDTKHVAKIINDLSRKNVLCPGHAVYKYSSIFVEILEQLNKGK